MIEPAEVRPGPWWAEIHQIRCVPMPVLCCAELVVCQKSCFHMPVEQVMAQMKEMK